jgi:chromosome segregation ATPase
VINNIELTGKPWIINDEYESRVSTSNELSESSSMVRYHGQGDARLSMVRYQGQLEFSHNPLRYIDITTQTDPDPREMRTQGLLEFSHNPLRYIDITTQTDPDPREILTQAELAQIKDQLNVSVYRLQGNLVMRVHIIETLNTERATLRDQITHLEGSNRASALDIERLTRLNEELVSPKIITRDAISQTESITNDKESSQTNNLEDTKEYRDLSRIYQNRLNEINAEIVSLNTQKLNLQVKLSASDLECRNLIKEIADLNIERGKSKESLEQAIDESKQLKERLLDSEREVDSTRDAIMELFKSMCNLGDIQTITEREDQQNKILKVKLAQASLERDIYEGKLKEVQVMGDYLQNQLESIEQIYNSNISTNKDIKEISLKMAETILKVYESRINIQTELSVVETRNKEIVNVLEDGREVLGKNASDAEIFQYNLDENSRSIKNLHDHVNDLTNHTNDLGRKNTSLNMNIAKLTEQLEEAHVRNSKLIKELDQHKHELGKTQSSFLDKIRGNF